MAGATRVAIEWNTFSDGLSVAANDQFLLASLGTGWFVTRLRMVANFVFGPLVDQLPNNTTPGNWPGISEPSMLQGIQSGPTGYGGISNARANINDPHWWLIEEVRTDEQLNLQFTNPPYVQSTYHQCQVLEGRFGAVPQAVAQDFWVTVGWSVGQTIPTYFAGWFYGTAELWYG